MQVVPLRTYTARVNPLPGYQILVARERRPMRDERACESRYSSERAAPSRSDASDPTEVWVSVVDRALARFFAIGLQLERALDLTLNPMVRPRIARALSEADQAIQELREALVHGRCPVSPEGSKVITVRPEAWYSVDAGVQGAYRARAAQLGVHLEVGDTGIPNRNVILVLDDKAEWFPSGGRSQDDAGWERQLQELLDLD